MVSSLFSAATPVPTETQHGQASQRAMGRQSAGGPHEAASGSLTTQSVVRAGSG
ncbi:MAG TPA: hypothetical protein VLQ80_02170 [Candidatus Saccharimonadia bacterium]|nr:hypothetical protein [Candidatus Saccharimonadia bacterium]